MPARSPAAALLLALAIPLSPLSAQEPAQPAKAAAQDEKAARDVIARAAAAYAALKAYQDKAVVRMTIELEPGEDQDAIPPEQDRTLTFRFARPDRFILKADSVELRSDGDSLWTISDGLDEYTQEKAPHPLDWDGLVTQPGGSEFLQHPVAAVLLRAERAPLLLRPLERLTGVSPGERNGEPGKWVAAIGRMEEFPGSEEVSYRMWFSDRTGLLGEVEADMSKAYRKMLAEMEEMRKGEEDDGFTFPKIAKMVMRTSLDDIRVDGDAAAEGFAFVPGPAHKKVDELSWGMGQQGDQQELVGRPAPALQGEALDGQPLSLDALKGRVVVLDFWATWCGPCVAAIPHIQELSQKFKDKPVTVIGVNSDQPGSTERVKKFLEKKEITFRQLMDEGKTGAAYMVSGIPCTVLIDTKGIVQAVHVGFMPGQEEELSGQIESLLAGKDLFDPAAVRKPDPDAPPAPKVEAPAAEVTPERLVSGSTTRGGFSADHLARRMDVDGDGATDLVGPDQSGGLVIVHGGGDRTSRVKLSVPRSTAISAFEPVRLNGETHWAIACTAWSMRGTPTGASVSFRRSDGSEVWSYTPELPEGGHCELSLAAAGSGGDAAHLVVGVNQYEVTPSGRDSYMHKNPSARLVVLDMEGNTVSSRKVGQRLSSLQVLPGEGGVPTIIASVDGQFRRYTIDTAAQP